MAGDKGWKSPLSLGRCGRHNPWARRRWQSLSGVVSPPRKSLQLLIPTPHALVSPSTGSFPALEPAWGWQQRVQPGESPCPPAQPVPCSDSRELPSRTLLTALPGDAEASIPPSRVTPRGRPSGSQPRGSMGPSAPLPGAGSFPCQPCLDRLLPQAPLPQRAGYSTLIPSAGCHGKGIFILALGSGRISPLLFRLGASPTSQVLGEPAGL